MTLTTASRHSTRLETLGRTVKHYIPHALSSFCPLTLSNMSSNDRHYATQGGISPRSARPVSFGHYNLSGLQAPRFGQLLGEGGVPRRERERERERPHQPPCLPWSVGTSPTYHFKSHTCSFNACICRSVHFSSFLTLTVSMGLTILDTVSELAHFPAVSCLSSPTILSRPVARDNDHTLFMLLGAVPNTQLHVYSLASHSIIHRLATPRATSI